MADVSENELKTEIEKFLKTADLATTSTIKVRQMLEKKFDTDFTERKGLIKKLVMDYIDNQPSESEEEEEVKDEEEEEEEEQKKPPPKKKPASRKRKGSDADSDGDWKNKKTAKKGGGGRGKNSGYTRPLRLSPALAELMGAPEMPRHEVVKQVWAMIKQKNLYDPSNRQFAICDDALYKVFQTKRFRTFGMMKYLKTHFLD